MLDNAILLQDLFENVQRPSAIDHEIFGNNLEPINDRLAREDVMVVRGTQANANAVGSESIKTIRGQLISPKQIQINFRGRREAPAP